MSKTSLGLISGSAAFITWGLLPLYWKLLDFVPAVEILLHRIIWSAVFISLVLYFSSGLKTTIISLRRPKVLATFILSAIFVSANWLIFIWAVNSEYVLETSLGYFINPLINVLLGVLVLKERLSPRQVVAVILATAGVLYLTIAYGSFPWVAIGIALSFAIYGLIRKKAYLEALPGLFVETILLLIPALVYLILIESRGQGHFLQADISTKLIFIIAGPATAIPLLWFAHSARLLKYSTLGLLLYLSPTITFFLAVFVFNEPFTQAHLVCFSLIWSGLIVFSLDSYTQSTGRVSFTTDL